ncbi:lipid A deacylase LpxR family protein [Candidatus Colwellia aromaticivorans]|uniref:lipid A deacylase LpxR family protein n=1 Tax=Candidatus Colwellia aromaticivorans TaxID=2267621 RepID=UPI000DF3D168|nr:lipid A deacylase LpxR family protein [Candidatus Colwellia aromaticivorans]
MFKISFLYLALLFIPYSYAGQFHFQLENDVAFGEDGNYSNGMILGWESKPVLGHGDLGSFLGQWQNKLLLPQSYAEKAWGLKISQRMWTPNEIKITEPQPYERPYAGFLELEHHTAFYSSELAQKNWLSIGIIGPASGTEQLQGAIHKLIGASTPEGWAYQVENKATFQLGYEIDYLLLRKAAPFNSEWEVSTFSHNTLGNFRSDLNVGLTLRWGMELEKTFGRLSSHFGHAGNELSQVKPHSVTVYTRMQIGYRFNDLTIDGNLPYDSKVEFNHQQASAVVGAIYYYSGGAVTWSYNFYNKEYLTDHKEWHGYGLLQFRWAM